MSDCRACELEAEIGTEEVPHPIDPRAHECQQRQPGGAKDPSEKLLAAEREAICQMLESVEPSTRAERVLKEIEDKYLSGLPGHLVELLAGWCAAAADELEEWQGLIRARNKRPCTHPPGCTFCNWCGLGVPRKYVTTTSFRPAEGRMISLPEGCDAVLYVFHDRKRAAEINGSEDLVFLTETQRNAIRLVVDPETGETRNG